MPARREESRGFLCDEPSCLLHIEVPAGAAGEWVELEVDGHQVTVTWDEIAGRRFCPRCAGHRLGERSPAAADQGAPAAVAVGFAAS